jgi:hypothetical protein
MIIFLPSTAVNRKNIREKCMDDGGIKECSAKWNR